MNKKPFYIEQADKFRDHLSKNPDRDLLSLFDEWAESKDFSDEDRQNIFARFLARLVYKKTFLIPKLKVHLKDDPVALRDIVKLVLLAVELGEKNDIDNKGKL